MMKRRWSNNGGFTALRMLEESSAEVTSSSNGLVLTAGLSMSPSSLDSPDYIDSDLWPCNDSLTSAYNSHQNSVITSAHGCSPLSMQTNIMPFSQTPNPTHLNNQQQQNHNNNNNNDNENINNTLNGGIIYATTSLGTVITERLNSYHSVGYNHHNNINNNSNNCNNSNNNNNNHNMHHNMRNGLGSLQTSPLSSIGSGSVSSAHSQHSPTMLGATGNMAAHLVSGHLNANINNNNNNNNNINNFNNMNGIKHVPRSESVNSISSGRDDLSPSSSLNGYATNENCEAKKSKKGPAPRLQEELCLVCGDRASGYHYNALTCEGCKGFFRRSVTKNANYCCKFGHACEMDMYMRRKCQECRLKKCLAVGMRPECVVPENQCAMKRREKKAQKEKDKQQSSPMSNASDIVKKEILDLMTCEPPTHPTFPLLPEDILAKCQARNIPALTHNQLSVIYKLIWYQDGYEQPSEEDLKRIMNSPDEHESQHDMSFRHITEITILTVQLIVEFAKGLPAFTRIPQEDQITLLKACSSEVMMLRMARRYDHSTDSIFFANNRSYNRDTYKMAGVADNIEDLLHFCRQMYAMKVDNVEYALLTAIVIFSDRPGLEEAELVDAIQSYYIDTLRIYILNRHCGDPKTIVFFAKLLSILTELRTLGNQNAEMCFSLKLKNRKLPKFLEEIWDVHTIPPSVQSHIQSGGTLKTKSLENEGHAHAHAHAHSHSSSSSSNNSSSSHGHTQHGLPPALAASTSAEAQQQQQSAMLHNIKIESSPSIAPTNMSISTDGSPAGLNGSEYSDVSPVMPMMGLVMDQDSMLAGESGTAA